MLYLIQTVHFSRAVAKEFSGEALYGMVLNGIGNMYLLDLTHQRHSVSVFNYINRTIMIRPEAMLDNGHFALGINLTISLSSPILLPFVKFW